MALEEAKLEMKRKFEKGLEEAKLKSASQCNSAKLPKLVISKFKGTHLDWQRFWGQFKTEIDKALLPSCHTLKSCLFPKFVHLLMVCPFLLKGMKEQKPSLRHGIGKKVKLRMPIYIALFPC